MDSAHSLTSPHVGTIVSIAEEGARLAAGAPAVIIESMKMEHLVSAEESVEVMSVHVAVGDAVAKDQPLLSIRPIAEREPARDDAAVPERPAFDEAARRHAVGLDDARPEAVQKRHATGRRTARENVADLVDDGSFLEFGPLAIAAQRGRRELDELIERTPADGLIGGVATVNAALFGEAAAKCIVASYDYMVMAGTQGMTNHRKKDRLFELAARAELPVLLYTEGGGGRPGDTDVPGVSGLDCLAFALYGRLAGSVPLIGINAGYCFAGNAALLGSCDVVIATTDSNIGMAGPAMIEGGGLGTFAPTDIGPAVVHAQNGVIDVLVADEAEATSAARKVLGFTQGTHATWTAPEPDAARNAVPANRKHVYDIHDAIDAIVDVGSTLELRPQWNPGLVTTFARVEGSPIGIIANNPLHLSGAIDHGGAQKSADFMTLCDRWAIPIVFLCDTPGFMVGPESDAEGLPRSAGALFRIGGNLSVPFGTVITRKGYGLGAQAMAGGGFKEPAFTVSWPTGEFGPMGLEGAVRLGFSRELAEASEGLEREALFERLLDTMIEHGGAVNVASHFEIDDVIDPADTRRWISRLLF
ncbi:MAG: carboxyl transferase domain-containing protein [Acidimicrobiia bacterium]|nr:carboxyl transferase domain-containing protein [Acidimicrobiia bacterium]